MCAYRVWNKSIASVSYSFKIVWANFTLLDCLLQAIIFVIVEILWILHHFLNLLLLFKLIVVRCACSSNLPAHLVGYKTELSRVLESCGNDLSSEIVTKVLFVTSRTSDWVESRLCLRVTTDLANHLCKIEWFAAEIATGALLAFLCEESTALAFINI